MLEKKKDSIKFYDDKKIIRNQSKNIKENNLIYENKRITKKDISNVAKFTELLKKTKPEILDLFEIKELIGKGSESIVFKVIYKKNNNICTMKAIINENRNINEIKIMNKLKNRNIISFYGVYEIKKSELDCIIMEYASFGNLKEFRKNILKRNYLSEQLLCFLGFQILNGIRYLHYCKITHFDLKPQNIIIDEYLNIKIIDFSVSVDYSAIKSSIKLPYRGTNFYIPPEVIQSKIINVKDLNKIDLYSFGVILYNMAFLSYPYDLNPNDYDNNDKIYEKIQNNELKFKNEDKCYSDYFIDFLKKLLEKDINKRINIKDALNHYWIKGANILLDEKEKFFNASSFLINLITDNFINFDKFMHVN